jgi:peptide/nickel transport system ATP-binding protein
LFSNPKHPYTKALLDSYPSLHGPKSELKPVEGEPPNLINPPPGCKFHPRCPAAEDKCKTDPPVYKEYESGHWTACHFPCNSVSPTVKD